MKKLARELKEFAVKGNAFELAVGVIIGAAFGKIISSVVNDLAMPIVGTFLGGVDFSSWQIELPSLFAQADPIYLNLGIFINTIIEFIIIALVVFAIVKSINKMKKKKEEAAAAAPPAPSKEEQILAEIRDILKKQEERLL
jgi:large conductance mechanosensitive channel